MGWLSFMSPSRMPSNHSLRRDIAWALAVKLIALAALYFAFFGPSHRVEMTPSRVATAIEGAAQQNGDR